MWFAKDIEYRQWESLEFTDFLNPTNGDERHLNYFHMAPATMRSQLLTMASRAHNADGMFYCVSVSAPNDHQFGVGDPCPPSDHPDDIAMFFVGVYEMFALANDTALVQEVRIDLTRLRLHSKISSLSNIVTCHLLLSNDVTHL